MFTPECQRQLDNLDKLIAMWHKIEPSTVDLHYYERCGSLHCIGGWVAVRGEFDEVKVTPGGYPTMLADDRSGSKPYWLIGNEVAEELFGDGHLFDTRGGHPADDDHRGWSDWQVALARMHYAKDQLCRRSSDVHDTNPAQPKGANDGK